MSERIDLDVNVDNSDIKNLDIEFNKVDQTVNLLVEHLNQVENKIVKIKNVTRNVTQNIQNTTNKGPVFNGATNTIMGPNGTAYSGTSTRTNAYKRAADDLHDYQVQEIEFLKKKVEYEKSITDYKRTQILYYKQDLDTQTAKAQAKLLKSQYYNSAEHLGYEQALADKHNNLAGWYAEKSAHPEKFLSGALLHSTRYQTGRGFNMVGDSVSSLGAGGKVLGGILKTIGDFAKSPKAGAATAISTLTKGIIDLGQAATKAYSEIEAIKTQLGVVFSNQTQADSVFGEISQYAVKSPFGVQQTSELAVLLKQSGVYASDLMDTLRMIGDTAGGNMEKMKRIANNYAQIVSIGKASMLDMRQFAYAGIPIFEAVSKELKVSQQELRKMISDGKVTSDIIEKVFKDLTGINGIFENATEKGAKTLKARLQNLSDAKQLAMGTIGNWGVNLGTTYGNDSIANNILTGVENVYQWLKDSVNTVNIESSVEMIKNQQKYIETLEKQIAEAEKNGRFAEAEELKTQLEKITGLTDIDRNRSTLNESYNNKYNNYDDLKNRLESSVMYSQMKTLWAELGYSDKEQFSLQDYQTVADMFGLDTLSLVIKELIKAEQTLGKITTEETQAHKESNIINAQQLAFDQASKASGDKLSYATGFEKLYSIYTSSNEYKKAKEQEEANWLKESQKVLKELLSYKGKDGNVDITRMTYEKLVEYLDEEKRVLDEGRKLTVVKGKSDATMTADREILAKQYRDIYTKIDTQLQGTGDAFARGELGRLNRQINYDADNKTFFEQFARVLDDELSIFDSLIENAEEDDKDTYRNMRKALLSSTFAYGAPSAEGLNADVNAAYTNQFIPLWKRILSQYTGLTTNGMTDTLSTMKNYRDDMAIRNTTAGVLKATLSSVGYDAAMGLIKTGSAEQLAGDNGKTFQTDWQATQKAVKEFALSLKATTEVVSAYRKGLEDQMEVYEQLLAAGPTQAESTDLGSQKFVTVKQLEKLSQGNSSQLVNAFGEVIRTKSGEEYKASEVIFKNGKMFDKLGNEIIDEVEITGNLFEFIKAELPKLRAEIAEARVKEANSAEYDKVVAEWAKHELTNRTANFMSGYHSELSGYLLDNPDYVNTQFNNLFQTVLDKHKEDKRYEDLIASGNKNVLSTALMATPEFLDNMHKSGWSTDRYDAANELVQETLDLVVQAAKQLGVADTGSVYQTFRDNLNTTEFNKLVSDRFRVLINSAPAQQLSLGAYADQNGIGGSRGVTARVLSNFFGLDRGYDLQSLYAYGREKGASLSITDSMKKKYNYEKEGNTLNVLRGEELSGDMEKLYEAAVRFNQSMKDTEEVARELGADLQGAFGTFARGAWEKPFEKMGENLLLGKEATDGMEDVYKNLSAELLKASSAAMVKAGWELVARGAADKNYGMIAGGLGLVAAGGVAAGFSSALTQKDDKDKSNKEAEKLENLKSDLQKLLEQARTDALYYENNLRHQTALGLNREFSYKSVHDAILTPKGDVVTTDPKDYLIATKQPQNLVGGGNVTVQPVINNNIVNNTSSHVRQEQTQNADGSIDILTIIEDTVGQYIASPKSDEAFATREYRVRGRQAIM